MDLKIRKAIAKIAAPSTIHPRISPDIVFHVKMSVPLHKRYYGSKRGGLKGWIDSRHFFWKEQEIAGTGTISVFYRTAGIIFTRENDFSVRQNIIRDIEAIHLP